MYDPNEEMAAHHRRQTKLIRRLAVFATELATEPPDTEYGVFTLRADATGFMGGDAGHGGNACVTIENDGGSLDLELSFDGQHNFDAFVKSVREAQFTGSHKVAVTLNGGDAVTVIASGDWEQGDLTSGLARCFVKLAKKLNWLKD